MSREIDLDLVRSLALGIVRRVAPAERETFEIQSEAYLADPRRALAGDKPGGDRLGSGITEIVEVGVPVLTPLAMAVATEVVLHVMRKRVGPGVMRAGRAAADAVRRLLQRPPDNPDEPLVELPPEERAEVRRIVVEVVVDHGQSDEVARRIAEAIVGDTGCDTDNEPDHETDAGQDGSDDANGRR